MNVASREVPRLVLLDLDDGPPESSAMTDVIGLVQRALFKYPAAVQAAFASLLAEGRRFAQTEEGKQWCARLEASAAIARGRLLWEAMTFNALEPEPTEALPSALLDIVAQAISRVDFERWLTDWTETTAGTPVTGESDARG
jgi:hypothetical protein